MTLWGLSRGASRGRHRTKEAGKAEREESQAKRERQEQGRETGPTGWAWEVSRLLGPSGGRRVRASFNTHLLSPWCILDAGRGSAGHTQAGTKAVPVTSAVCHWRSRGGSIFSVDHQGTPDGGGRDPWMGGALSVQREQQMCI